jgi:hypothetical protein
MNKKCSDFHRTKCMELSTAWDANSCTTTHKLPSISWNPGWGVITTFTTALHLSLSWARSILILSTHLHLDLPSGLSFKYVWSGIWISQESVKNTNCPIHSFKVMLTAARGSMVEALGYKPEGRGLNSWQDQWIFQFMQPFQLQSGLWHIWVLGIFLGLRGRPVCKANTLMGVWAHSLDSVDALTSRLYEPQQPVTGMVALAYAVHRILILDLFK